MLHIVETKDHNLLAKLNEEIQTFHHNILPQIFKPYNEKAISSFFKTALHSDNTMAYVAKEDETNLGYILMFKIQLADNPFQYSRSSLLIDQILVLKNYQGKGVGKKLLAVAIAFAKANKVDYIELNHWTQNESAREFFIKNNFTYYNEKMWMPIEY